MKCFNCGTKNRKKAIFCQHCGQRLTSFCPACGNHLRHPATFCDRCGHTIGEALSAFNAQPGKRPVTSTAPVASSAPVIPADLRRFVPKEFAEKLQNAQLSRAMVGERRVVTMLFCDVKGSTAAAGGLDPEEWTEIINGAFEHMIRPVYKYEGTVARLMGDGILAFFGAPIAHEDDPQRGILAGLEIVAGIHGYREEVIWRYEIDLDVRVGINTGMVVVGAVGSDLRMEYTAMGDAINLAARMEQTAEPGTVQIAQPTYKLVKHLFDFEVLGGIKVKGKVEPVLAYRVSGRKSVPGQLRGIAGLQAPLIGRETEWTGLLSATRSLKKGVGHIIFLVGEAGLGKSRLINELNNALNEDEVATLSWYETTTLSFEVRQPYGLFQRLARRLCRISASDSPSTIRQKLEATVQTLPEVVQSSTRRVFETFFGLPSADDLPPLEGESFKGQLAVVNETLWRFQAASKPVILVCDDLHWADPASISLLESLFPLSDEVPILFLCAMRPERSAPGWKLQQIAAETYAHRFTEYKIRPLTAEDSNLLIDSLLTISELPQTLRQNIMAKAEGNPFFVEEVIRSLIDSGEIVHDGSGTRWVATDDGSAIDIPDNLQALLIARIDKLDEVTRRVLQLASLIGRNFHFRVLELVIDRQHLADSDRFDGKQLTDLLAKLLHAELIREVARLPELEYMFRHALTREAAYRTILHKLRRHDHQIVGEVMEQYFADRLEEYAPTLAHHFQEAGDKPRAIRYHTMAADAAYRLYALSQAVDHYNQALALSDLLNDNGEELIHLFSRRGRAMELDNDYADALENYAEMERLAAERTDEKLKLAALLARTIVHSTFTAVFDPEIGLPLAEDALTLARRLGERAVESKVLWSLMLVHFFTLANPTAAIRYGQEALALAREHDLDEQLPFILNDLGRIMGFNGQLREGRSLAEEAIQRFELSGNLPLLQDSLNSGSILAYFAGEYAQCLEQAKEGLRVSRSINNQWGIDSNRFDMAVVYIEQGDYGQALANLHQDLEEKRDFILALPELARIHFDLGEAERIAERFKEVHEQNFAIGPMFQQIFLASMARAYIRRGDWVTAERFWQELEVDEEQQWLLPVNRESLITYAELLLAQGHYKQAAELLERLISRRQEIGFLAQLGDLYLLQAQALLAQEPPDTAGARVALKRGLSLSREQGARRVLWKILLALAELSATDEALRMRQEALEIVTWISDHIGDPQLQESFLNLPTVRSLLALQQVELS